MDIESRLLGNCISTAASNFWDCLTKPGEVDYCLLPTSWLKLSPQGGVVPIIPIITGEEVSMMPIALPMSPGVLLLMPILLTCRVVL